MSSRRFSKRLETKSYFLLVTVLSEKKKTKTKERCKDENRKLCVYSCRYAYKLEEYLSEKFTIHRHNLWGAQHNLFIPQPNTEALKKSFRYRGAVTWNMD